MSHAYLARQPIFNRDLEVIGYELLFRDPPATTASVSDHRAATAQVILTTLTEIGLEQVVGSTRAWINLSRELLLSDLLDALPTTRVGVEVLEDQLIDDALIEAVAAARERGFCIALDDFELGTEADRLLPHADVVKLDMLALGRAGLAEHVEALRKFDVTVLVEKVETREDHRFARELGCERFQGFFYRRPELLSGRRIDVAGVALMRLLSRLQDPTTPLEDVTREVSHDVSLSLRLLRYINSAYLGLPHAITSVAQAVTLLGPQHLRRWAMLSAFAGLAGGRTELTRTALVRARFCELAQDGQASESAQRFTLGLFSVVDALTDSPLEDALRSVPFPEEMREALIDHTGPMGRLLGAVVALEEGSFERAEVLCPASSELYLQALCWADTTVGALDARTPATPTL